MIIRNKGSTVYGPGEAIATLVKTILGDENRILTVSAYIRREVHDIGDVCISVPARVNRSGVFPVTIKIDESEVIQFRESVEKIKESPSRYLQPWKKKKQGKNPKTKKRSSEKNICKIILPDDLYVRVSSIISARSTPFMH